MHDRRVLIIGEAAGSPEVASGTFGHLGFSAIVTSPRLDQAMARLRTEVFDVLIVPLGGMSHAQLELLGREIRTHSGLSVIGTAPVADPDLILGAMRAGVHEFLVSPPSMEDLSNAAQRLGQRAVVSRTGRIIAVYSGKGGLGTTSIAVNTADAFAASSPAERIALVDCVFTGGDIRVFLNLRPAYHLGDLITKLDEIDSGMLRSFMTAGPHGTCVLPAADDPLFDDAFDGASVSVILGHLRDTFQTTIVDCEHQLSERTLAVLDAADTILVVTQPSVPALRSTKRTLDLFQRLGYSDSKIEIVLNRFQFGDVFTLATVAESLKHEVYWGLPNDYRAASGALNKGVAISTEDPTSKLARSYEQLVEKLRSKSNPRVMRSNGEDAPPSRLRKFFGKYRGDSHVA